MINTFLFDKKEKFDNVEKPFYYIYKKYYESISNINNKFDYYKYVLTNDNNSIFYKGIEHKIEKICETKKIKIIRYIDFYTKNFINNVTNYHFIKTKLKNKNNKKAKSLISILVQITIDSLDENKIQFDILFPIEYKNFHNE